MKNPLFLFCAALLLPAWAAAADKTLALGGGQAGCPMKLVYSPAAVSVDPAGALAYAAPLVPDLLEAEGLAGIGSFKEPGTGRAWYAYASLGMSCDPYFLFLSSGPKGKEEVIVNGETLRFTSAENFSVKQRFNLHFEIERRLGWSGGRPAEQQPDYYPLNVKTRTLRPVPVSAVKGKPHSGLIQAKARVTITGYDIDGRVPLALVKGPDGRSGWAELGRDMFEGVAYKGD